MRAQIDADPAFQGDHIVLPIIIYLDKTTMDGLRRVSVFPMYVSLANFDWEFYNAREGMELVALLPQPHPDPHWPEPGYKPDTDAHRDLKRWFLTSSLAIITEDARQASFTGIEFQDPRGVTRKGVPMLYCISKDLGEASTISNVMSNHCDSCLVRPEKLHDLPGALAGEYGPRLEPNMRAAVNGLIDLKEDPTVSKKAVAEERRKNGVHSQMVRAAYTRHSHRQCKLRVYNPTIQASDPPAEVRRQATFPPFPASRRCASRWRRSSVALLSTRILGSRAQPLSAVVAFAN